MEPNANNRIDFMYIFDVTEGNPNGDPDNEGRPRVDPDNGLGIVTDICIKRKIRNYVAAAKPNDPRFGIFVQQAAVLNNVIEESAEAVSEIGAVATKSEKKATKAPKTQDKRAEELAIERARHAWLCDRYFDIRAFGQVLSTSDKPLPPLRGPVQFTNFKSTHPIRTRTMSITRCAVTNVSDEEKKRTMGKKFVVPYAAYVGYGFYSAHAAGKTGFNRQDLELLVESLALMWESDRSAMRGFISPRYIACFSHDSVLGDCPAQRCFDTIRLAYPNGAPGCWDDIAIHRESPPVGVSCTVWDG